MTEHFAALHCAHVHTPGTPQVTCPRVEGRRKLGQSPPAPSWGCEPLPFVLFPPVGLCVSTCPFSRLWAPVLSLVQGHSLCSRAESRISFPRYVFQSRAACFCIWICFPCCPERREQSNFLFTPKFQASNFEDLETVRERLLLCVRGEEESRSDGRCARSGSADG